MNDDLMVRIEQLRGEVKELRARVDGLEKLLAANTEGTHRRIDDILAKRSHFWTIAGGFVAIGTLAVTVFQYWPVIKSFIGG